MTENQVESEIIKSLRSNGWICRRQHVGVYKTLDGRVQRIGEPGECDWRCMKPAGGGLVRYFELEVKATDKTPDKRQLEYMAKRTAQGFIAIWADSLAMLISKLL